MQGWDPWALQADPSHSQPWKRPRVWVDFGCHLSSGGETEAHRGQGPGPVMEQAGWPLATPGSDP